MAEISLQSLGIVIDGMFTEAVPFLDADCGGLAKKCLQLFSGYGLKANQISVRRRDQVFNYELLFQLFNGNGTFKISSERLHIELQNARLKVDFEIIADCVTKMYEIVPSTRLGTSSIAATIQTTMSPPATAARFFSAFSTPKGGIDPVGIIIRALFEPWPQKIKLVMEESAVHPEGLFFALYTDHIGQGFSRETFSNLEKAFTELLGKYDLHFPKSESSAKS